MDAILAIGLMVVAVAVIAGLVKILDLKRQRESEGVRLQAQVSDALLRDPQLFGLPIAPSAHVPWRGSPATLEITGQVPSEALRQAALRLSREEAARVRPDVLIEDRLQVASTMPRAA